jgi:hypothetical protein
LLDANGANQFLEALTFGVEHPAAEGRQAVIAASGVVEFRGGAFVGFLDEFGFDQALEWARMFPGACAVVSNGIYEPARCSSILRASRRCQYGRIQSEVGEDSSGYREMAR